MKPSTSYCRDSLADPLNRHCNSRATLSKGAPHNFHRDKLVYYTGQCLPIWPCHLIDPRTVLAPMDAKRFAVFRFGHMLPVFGYITIACVASFVLGPRPFLLTCARSSENSCSTSPIVFFYLIKGVEAGLLGKHGIKLILKIGRNFDGILCVL